MRSLGLLALLAALAAAPLRAQGLASPGPLAEPHARLDGITRCLSCHEAGRSLSGRKCLDCHASLAARLAARRGYHATATRDGAELRCAACHADHNGRPFRLVRWPNGSRDRFDHREAGWPLEGAHQRAACTDCHRAPLIADAAVRADTSLDVARTFLGLSRACASCHLDEHRGRTSRQCQDCHGTERWTPAAGFNHDRTDFALTGLHRAVRCAQCHTVRRDAARGPGGARDTSFVDFGASREGRTCAACHRSPHRESNRLGRCEACHTTGGWLVISDSLRAGFDHGRTRFPLRGAHGAVRCETCHRNQTRRFARCDDCHADPHAGQIAAAGRDCSACHDEQRFAATLYTPAMHAATRFPLDGAHEATPCSACHQPLAQAARGSGRSRFRFDDLRCSGCHRDPHQGQFAGRACESCHATASWLRPSFDHDSTRYPLRGAHEGRPCAACHTGRPVRFTPLPLTCGSAGCHEDPHGGQFAGRERGDACTTCHTEARWSPAEFDHQRDAAWALDGRHANAPCVSCHRREAGIVRYRPLPQRCEDCHR